MTAHTFETTPPNMLSAEPLTAHDQMTDLLSRRQFFDVEYDSFKNYDVGQAQTVLVEHWGDNNMHMVIDISDHPGGAFKYVSALGAVASMNPWETTAVAATAGNYGATLGQACLRFSKSAIAYTPRDLNPVKYHAMADSGMTIEPYYSNVEDAVKEARATCEQDVCLAQMHPFNNPNGVAALTYIGDQVIDQVVASRLDMSTYRTKFLVQRGGGSLLSAMAVSVSKAKQLRGLRGDASVWDVRPERNKEGGLDPLYDGLKVETPGSIAQSFLRDKRYVAGSYAVSRAATADAARAVVGRGGVSYEANALVGVGAYIEQRDKAKDTLFVSLLTGTNVPQEQVEELFDAPGLPQRNPGQSAMAVLGGYVRR